MKRGFADAATNDPQYSLVYSATTIHDVITTVKYLFQEDSSATDTDMNFNCIRWEMEKWIGLHSDEWIDMVASVQEGGKFWRHPTLHVQAATAGEAIVDKELKLWDTGDGRIFLYRNVVNPRVAEFTIRRVSGSGGGALYISFYDEDSANWNYYLFITGNGDLYAITTDTGVDIGSTCKTIRVEQVGTTRFSLHVDGVLINTYDMAFENVAGIKHVILSSTNGPCNFEFRAGYFDVFDVPEPTIEVPIQNGSKKFTVARSIRSVSVYNKKLDQEITVSGTVGDVNYDPSADSAGDPNSPRDVYIVDADSEDIATSRQLAISTLEAGTSNKINFLAKPLHQAFIPKVGKYYRFTREDGTHYNEFCRRVSFSWDGKSGRRKWEMEFGTGSTMGVEKSQRFVFETKDELQRIRAGVPR